MGVAAAARRRVMSRNVYQRHLHKPWIDRPIRQSICAEFFRLANPGIVHN